MTVEQLRQQTELNLVFNKERKQHLYSLKDRKLDGSRKLWENSLTIYSTKIQLLEEILEYIDQSKQSLNNSFINNTK